MADTAQDGSEQQVASAFEALPRLLDADSALIRAGRRLDVDCLLGPAGKPYLVSICQGRIAQLALAPKTMPSWRFSYTASLRGWIEYWRAEPAPGWHDLLSLTKRSEAILAGDIHPFMTHLQYFKDVLALPRSLNSGRNL